jgi:hypothetical protein
MPAEPGSAVWTMPLSWRNRPLVYHASGPKRKISGVRGQRPGCSTHLEASEPRFLTKNRIFHPMGISSARHFKFFQTERLLPVVQKPRLTDRNGMCSFLPPKRCVEQPGQRPRSWTPSMPRISTGRRCVERDFEGISRVGPYFKIFCAFSATVPLPPQSPFGSLSAWAQAHPTRTAFCGGTPRGSG